MNDEIMSRLNEAIETSKDGEKGLKSAVSGRDSKAILEECERGEDYAKARYAEALRLDLPERLLIR